MNISKRQKKIRTLTYDFIGNYCLITITNIYVRNNATLMIFSVIILLTIDNAILLIKALYKERRIFTNAQSHF
jgi:hypothetical protein